MTRKTNKQLYKRFQAVVFIYFGLYAVVLTLLLVNQPSTQTTLPIYTLLSCVAIALSLSYSVTQLVIAIKTQKKHKKHTTPNNSAEFLEFLNKLPASTLDLMYTIDKHGNEHRATFTIEDGKITDMK